jgi:adenylosuccinate synthase
VGGSAGLTLTPPRVHAVVGLGFGDEGKGAIVDHLVRRLGARAVVRFGGGPQATHHVVLPDGRWHGFSQLGAGAFVAGVASHQARGALVEPWNLLREDEALRAKGVHDALARHSLDPRAALVLPFHKLIGQLEELARGDRPHGSVGLGVGAAARDRAAGLALRLEDARDPTALRVRLHDLVPARLAAAEALVARIATSEAEERLTHFRGALDLDRLTRMLSSFARGYAALLVPDEARLAALLAAGGPLVLEGAQGALLDPSVGWAPHVTKTPSTAAPALELVLPEPVVRTGVLRAYAHRHGPGPLPTEDAELGARLAEAHNRANRWQGPFRVGRLDLVLARHAAATGVDRLALTCLDRLRDTGDVRVVTAYAHPGPPEPWFDDAFVWRPDGDALRIDALLPGAGGRPEVGRVLGACRPASEVRLPGWSAYLADGLPPGARALIELLESRDGLGLPVDVVSIGPTWREKLVR